MAIIKLKPKDHNFKNTLQFLQESENEYVQVGERVYVGHKENSPYHFFACHEENVIRELSENGFHYCSVPEASIIDHEFPCFVKRDIFNGMLFIVVLAPLAEMDSYKEAAEQLAFFYQNNKFDGNRFLAVWRKTVDQFLLLKNNAREN